MIMTSFHQNQSPPISGERGVGDRGVGESWGGKEERAWLARPPAGQKEKGGGAKMDSIPGNPLGQGTAWSWQPQSGRRVFKNSSLGVISKLQSARAEWESEDLTNSSG